MMLELMTSGLQALPLSYKDTQQSASLSWIYCHCRVKNGYVDERVCGNVFPPEHLQVGPIGSVDLEVYETFLGRGKTVF